MSAALNISKEIGFQEGICEAIMLKIITLEVTGDIRGAFQLAVLLKTIDLKVNNLKVNNSRDVYAKSTYATRSNTTHPANENFLSTIVTNLLIGFLLHKMASFLVKCIYRFTTSWYSMLVLRSSSNDVNKEDNTRSSTSTERFKLLVHTLQREKWYLLSFLGDAKTSFPRRLVVLFFFCYMYIWEWYNGNSERIKIKKHYVFMGREKRLELLLQNCPGIRYFNRLT